jgi:hypothetical protein
MQDASPTRASINGKTVDGGPAAIANLIDPAVPSGDLAPAAALGASGQGVAATRSTSALAFGSPQRPAEIKAFIDAIEKGSVPNELFQVPVIPYDIINRFESSVYTQRTTPSNCAAVSAWLIGLSTDDEVAFFSVLDKLSLSINPDFWCKRFDLSDPETFHGFQGIDKTDQQKSSDKRSLAEIGLTLVIQHLYPGCGTMVVFDGGPLGAHTVVVFRTLKNTLVMFDPQSHAYSVGFPNMLKYVSEWATGKSHTSSYTRAVAVSSRDELAEIKRQGDNVRICRYIRLKAEFTDAFSPFLAHRTGPADEDNVLGPDPTPTPPVPVPPPLPPVPVPPPPPVGGPPPPPVGGPPGPPVPIGATGASAEVDMNPAGPSAARPPIINPSPPPPPFSKERIASMYFLWTYTRVLIGSHIYRSRVPLLLANNPNLSYTAAVDTRTAAERIRQCVFMILERYDREAANFPPGVEMKTETRNHVVDRIVFLAIYSISTSTLESDPNATLVYKETFKQREYQLMKMFLTDYLKKVSFLLPEITVAICAAYVRYIVYYSKKSYLKHLESIKKADAVISAIGPVTYPLIAQPYLARYPLEFRNIPVQATVPDAFLTLPVIELVGGTRTGQKHLLSGPRRTARNRASLRNRRSTRPQLI